VLSAMTSFPEGAASGLTRGDGDLARQAGDLAQRR